MSKKEKQFSTPNLERVIVTPSIFKSMKHYQKNLGETITDHILEFSDIENSESQNAVIKALKKEKERVTRWLINHCDVTKFNPFHAKVA